jgi:hypothetical protein
MAELGRKASREVGAGRGVVAVEFAPAGVRYLSHNIRPCIFAHDLVAHGKVLWGPADILREVRSFGVEAIPREDAIRLVMNRTMERLLTPGGPGDGTETSRPDRAYQLVKTILDLAGSALAFAGRYASRYGERPAAFSRLLADCADLRESLPAAAEFERELAWATECKLFPRRETLLAGDLRARAIRVSGWTRSIWEWEVRTLLDRPRATFPELVEAFLRHEGVGDRLKGWVKYYRHPLRPKQRLGAARSARLLFQASPQTLVYAAALLAHEGAVAGRSEWIEWAASLVPGPAPPEHGTLAPQVYDLWRWLVRNN